MDTRLCLVLLSLLHAGQPQDYRSGSPFGRGPGGFPDRPYIDGPEARMPPPDYSGPSPKSPDINGPMMRHYGGNNNYGPPNGPPPPNQYAWPPPDFRPNMNRPYPVDPFQKRPPNNKPPPYNGPYGQPPFQGPPRPFGGPPNRPDQYGPPPSMNRPLPPWAPQGGYPPGPQGFQQGPPSSFGQPVWPNKKPEPSVPNKPIDFMADVVNSLAARVLLDHVTARGNFVFSPYGATSVLCVLNEGASGMSAIQLSTTLNLPKDIEMVRIGMRDMHRHLKSYFKHNGFLQGVDLSHNNTSLRADFIPLLRFYGYHVDEEGKHDTEQSTQMPDKVEATTMPMNDEDKQEDQTSNTNEGDNAPPSDSLTQEEPATEEQPMEEEQATDEATEEAATEEAPEGDEKKRKKRAMTLWKDIVLPSVSHQQGNPMMAAYVSANHALFPDIELNNGLAQSNQMESTTDDPLAPRKRFRLFSGEFTKPVVVQERTEMIMFSSLPQLGAVAALLPLDEPRYGLLVLVPYDGRPLALKQLVKEMTNVPLRKILDSLRPNHVHFSIPSFSAKGTVVLTSALQQIGISDIFDPRNAKLDRMSVDSGLFVRHLEQAIDMNFGKVTSLHTRVITARSTTEVLDAMRPFIYFVIDRPSKVALLAGKVEDPTTQRIF